jgi:hypothetical protein
MVKHDCGRGAACAMSAGYRKRMADVIPTLDAAQRTEVYSLLVKEGVRHTSNSNGKFFEISSVPCSALKKLRDFIDHCERTSTALVQTETERSLTAAFARTNPPDPPPSGGKESPPQDAPEAAPPAPQKRAGGNRRQAVRRTQPPPSDDDPPAWCTGSLLPPDLCPVHTAKDEADKFVQARKRYCKPVQRKVVLRNELAEEPLEPPVPPPAQQIDSGDWD